VKLGLGKVVSEGTVVGACKVSTPGWVSMGGALRAEGRVRRRSVWPSVGGASSGILLVANCRA